MDKNTLANAGNTSLIPSPRRFHTRGQLKSAQLLGLHAQSLCSARSHHSEKPKHCNWRAAPTRRSWRKPVHSSEDPSSVAKIHKTKICLILKKE